MAKKVRKTRSADDGELGKKVDDLIRSVDEDRERLVSFLEDLIANYGGEQSVGIAEYVAKIADALTRQNQVRLGVLKVAGKNAGSGDDGLIDEINEEVGLPFGDDVDGSSN